MHLLTRYEGDEPQKQNAERKPVTKRHGARDPTYMIYPEQTNPRRQRVAAGGWGGKNRGVIANGYRESPRSDENISDLERSNGCKTL